MPGYPVFLCHGNKINTEYTRFGFEPRLFTEREAISVGIDLEGNNLCYGKNLKPYLCSKELYDSEPLVTIMPKESENKSDANYSEKEAQKFNTRREERNKQQDDARSKWYETVEKAKLVEINFIAVDSNGQEIPLVTAMGDTQPHCQNKRDGREKVCYSYGVDYESKFKTLEGLTIVSVKIKSAEGNLTTADVYAVKSYKVIHLM